MAAAVTFYGAFRARYGDATNGLKDGVKLFNNFYGWLRYLELPMAGKLAASADVTSKTKSCIALVDLYKKTDDLFKVFSGQSQENLHEWGNGTQRSSFNSAVVTVGKVGEWGVHLNEVTDLFRSVDLLHVTKEGAKQLKWFSSGAILVKATTGLYAEAVNLSLANREVSCLRRSGAAEVRARTIPDWFQTAIKIAMNLSFLEIGCIGVAGLLGYVVPAASLLILSCSTLATVAGIIDHFVTKLYVEPLNRQS